jgi:nucleoside-diphosphate-sugar epimerase
MKLLIIGGTQFLGRHLTESALARGHEITLFNRGLTNPELFPDLLWTLKKLAVRKGASGQLVGPWQRGSERAPAELSEHSTKKDTQSVPNNCTQPEFASQIKIHYY